MRDDFIVFILTHGRPNNIKTLDTLKKAGYKGRICILIDTDDKTAPEYFKKYGGMVYQFDKDEMEGTFDTGDNGGSKGVIIYARNKCFDVAEKLGARYFLELDDDYISFFIRHNEKQEICSIGIRKSLEKIFDAYIDFLENTPTATIAMTQGGDFIGGKENHNMKRVTLLRKAMNSFFCDVRKPFQFVGRINEDVNTYVSLGMIGKMFFSTTQCMLVQTQTQHNKGGMTGAYLESGTYLKSFYTVMMAPSCVTIQAMGETYMRLHHNIKWRNAVPCILRELLKK